VADSSEPFGILVELGLLLLGIGSDHANAYPRCAGHRGRQREQGAQAEGGVVTTLKADPN
jgi:hypothetical protein